MSTGEDKRPDEQDPEESRREEPRNGDAQESPSESSAGFAPAVPMTDRLERERRRAVRAEGRLAEIEMRLRDEIERGGANGIKASALQSLLASVQRRVSSLEDEVRASEREMMGLVSHHRKSLGTMAADNEDLAFGLEESRRELRDAVYSDRAGLPELTRRRVEFEVELDRLQSLLNYRDSVCDGLAEELEQGTRVTAEVTARLADLSRGRVAPARKLATPDARVATLRRNLESEQVQLRQSRRALEAARAELKIAQRGIAEAENKSAEKVNPLKAQVAELEIERSKLQEALDAAKAGAKIDRGRFDQNLERERTARVQASEAVRNLERKLADLESQLSISGEERQDQLRVALSERETELEQTEAERIRLAERVSLLQAALSSKDAELRRLAAGQTGPRSKGRVVSLVRDRLADGGESQAEAADKDRETADLIRQRQRDLDKLSRRWGELQEAYHDAVAEFDDVRAKRDRLLRKLGPGAGKADQPEGGIGNDLDAGKASAPDAVDPGQPKRSEPPLAAPPEPSLVKPDQRPVSTGEDGDSWVVQESAHRRVVLAQIDDDPRRSELVSRVAAEHDVRHVLGDDVEVPHGAELLVAVNLLVEGVEISPVLSELSRDEGALKAVLYAASDRMGRVFGKVDVFPSPFDPKTCAPYLLATYSRLRRVMTVGDSIDRMSQVRELLGQSRCSTAVAFDPRQAFDLISLVRPEYVLIDLSLPGGGGFDLLSELSQHTDPPLGLGVTWSGPVDGEELRAEVAKRCAHDDLDLSQLAASVGAMLRPAPPG